ncbi:MAG: hypothetical protein J5849_05440 [Clostridia bacterium]|nr:hypothetical protein [Clostridia bacterium]
MRNQNGNPTGVGRFLLKLLLTAVTALLSMLLFSLASSGILVALKSVDRSAFYGAAAILTVLLAGLVTGRIAAKLLPIRGLAAGGLAAFAVFLLMLLAAALLDVSELFTMWTLAVGSFLALGSLTGALIGAARR